MSRRLPHYYCDRVDRKPENGSKKVTRRGCFGPFGSSKKKPKFLNSREFDCFLNFPVSEMATNGYPTPRTHLVPLYERSFSEQQPSLGANTNKFLKHQIRKSRNYWMAASRVLLAPHHKTSIQRITEFLLQKFHKLGVKQSRFTTHR